MRVKERCKVKKYRGVVVLSVVGKIYAEVLGILVSRVSEGLIHDGDGVFREGKESKNNFFSLKH